MRILLYVLVVLVTLPARGASVAFLELYDNDGHRRELEPNGRFGHIAIRAGDRWLHAHPEVGVQLTEDLSPFGENMRILVNPHYPEPTPAQVLYYLSLRFHPNFEWNYFDGTTYCSRLVGELLGIEPLPATFSSPVWAGYKPPYGSVGLSPDDVYRALEKMGFRTLNLECVRALAH